MAFFAISVSSLWVGHFDLAKYNSFRGLCIAITALLVRHPGILMDLEKLIQTSEKKSFPFSIF